MSHSIIETENVTHHFGDVCSVDNLSLSVEAGEVFGFLGHNGAGKTTTIRLLNGVLQPDHGEIRVLGYNPQTQGAQLRSRIGILTETPSLEERLSANENLTIYANLYGVPQNHVCERVASVLEQFGLSNRAGEKVGKYSKGMKQRLALARAFLHEPELIFLDEPTSGLDPVATQEVHEMIRHVSQDEGRTVFLCTHNLIEAQRLCGRVAVMQQGRIVAIGTPSELAHNIGTRVRYHIDLQPDQINTAHSILETTTGIQYIQVEATQVKFTTDRETIPDLLASLIAQGIRIYAVTPEQPSLEDIYLTIHQYRESK